MFHLSLEFQTKFYNVLTLFWDEFHLIVWKLNKDFSAFNGAELKKFVANIPSVTQVMRDNLIMTDDILSICEGLDLWCNIGAFLKIAIVKDQSSLVTYPRRIILSEKQLVEFYKCGKKLFLTNINPGDDETF